MTIDIVVKYLHILGAVVILGTGVGVAFFMLMAHVSKDAAFIARTAGVVVIADTFFILSAVVAQPITGAELMMAESISIREHWIIAALALYVIAGLFWIPVTVMQVEMRDLAQQAADAGEPLPPRYHALFLRWVIFGIFGFGSVMAILWIMIAKPALVM
jgi:uncharacterized membrane protein